MKGFWFIVNFYGPDVWEDLDFWSDRHWNNDDIFVDYEFQKVWFKLDPNAV